MSFIIGANSAVAGGFDIDNSCRFDGTSSYMTKTLGTPTSAKKGTISYWFKQGVVNTGSLKTAFSFGAEYGAINYDTGSTKGFEINLSNGNGWYKGTNTGFTARDPGAWYHLMVVVDTTQGTEANRFKFFMNGSQITFTSGNIFPSLNGDIPGWASGQVMQVGRRSTTSGSYFDGYMAEVVFIDGSALTPSDFGEYDSDSGIWKPIDVSGLTFGTNGFYLDFKDSSNLGNDVNGGTDLTETGLAATDQTTDTCTNNFSTLNPLVPSQGGYTPGTPTFAESNLKFTTDNSSSSYSRTNSTFLLTAGKWYTEIKYTNSGTIYGLIGVTGSNATTTAAYPGVYAYDYAWYGNGSGGNFYNNNGIAAYLGAGYANNDILGMAIDLDSGTKTIQYYKNGSAVSSAQTIVDPATTDMSGYCITIGEWSSSTNATFEVNFGNPPYTISSGNADDNGYGNFEYAPPSGFLAMCTKNLSEVLS